MGWGYPHKCASRPLGEPGGATQEGEGLRGRRPPRALAPCAPASLPGVGASLLFRARACALKADGQGSACTWLWASGDAHLHGTGAPCSSPTPHPGQVRRKGWRGLALHGEDTGPDNGHDKGLSHMRLELETWRQDWNMNVPTPEGREGLGEA